MIMAKDSNNNYVKIEDIKQQNNFNGISPIEFKGSGENLENYRIYGNTVGGESVGDRTENLFDENSESVPGYINDGGAIATVPNYPINTYDYINVLPNTYYSYKAFITANYSGNQSKTIRISYYTSSKVFISRYFEIDNGLTKETIKTPNNCFYIRLSIDDNLRNVMLWGGSSDVSVYEPYGYRVPVTVRNGTDTQIVPIYLTEQIKKVGDEAEYVDYQEQKMHRARKNLLKNTATSQTIDGLTFTVNPTGSVTCNGRRENTSTFFTIGSVTTSGETILSGCLSGGSSTSFAMRAYSATISNPRVYYDIGDGCMLNTPDTYNIDIRIQSDYACDHLTFYPMIRKADIEDDTYEPYITNTELDVTLPALPTLSGTNTLSVKTRTKPSKVWGKLSDPRDILYVKDNLGNILFSKYHKIEGEPPLIYKPKKADTLIDYHIYGQTENGESVGDRTENICTNIWSHGVINDIGVVISSSTTVCSDFIAVTPNVIYSLTRTVGTNYNNLRCFDINKNYLGNGIACADKANPVSANETFGTFMITDQNVAFIRFNDASNSIETKYMMVEGTYTEQTMPAYEPCGYRVPVMVTNGMDAQTTNIYLPEQIKMVGDEAEYIDYGEQKLHRVRKNLLQNTASSQTKNGVTFTVNNDGSVTCNGTASNNTFFKIGDFSLASQSYILTGCPSDGGKDSYTLRCYENGNIKGEDVGNGFNINESIDGYIEIRIASGYTCDNLTFYPMIRKADITDDTYESYITSTEVDVTLPALPTLSGTNTLTVGTEVQPSKVYLKGKIEEIPTRTVSYYSQDGSTLLGTETVESGGNASGLQDTPTKPDTEQYTYTFVGWSNTTNATTAMSGILNNITADKSVYAAFSETEKTFEVDFYNGDTLLETAQNVAYNGTATYTGSTPTKASTAQYDYIFAGWTKTQGSTTVDADALTGVTADRNVYAVFTATARSYTVTFMNVSTLMDTQTVTYGGTAVYGGATPTKAETSEYTYAFAGWNANSSASIADADALTNVTADRTVYAIFTAVSKGYTVYFYNGETLLETVTGVPSGGTATYTGATPTSSQAGYIFSGWSPSNTNITADTACYAQFAEDEMYESITDTWSQIIANIGNGTYSTKYHIGDTKKIDLGTEGEVIMRIVGIDADDLADNSGKAPITWISKQLLKTAHRMNPVMQSGTSGTGALGGWEKSEMRSYLKETIKPLLPSEVRNALKTVKKYSKICNPSGAAVNNVVSNDDIWIPSAYEVNFSGCETSGVTYSTAFPDNASRIKHKVGDSAAVWWLRTARGTYHFGGVRDNGGGFDSAYAHFSSGVAVGFCT